MTQGAVRIAMWSGPRNISTAMMRAFENRADAVVWDEPFYAHYLAATGLDHAVVDGDLVEGVLADPHRGFLAFGHQHGLAMAIVHDNIGAEGFAVQVDALFYRRQPARITQVDDQILHQILPHPFLGCQPHVFAAQRI